MNSIKFSVLLLAIVCSGCCSRNIQTFNDGKPYYPNWCEYDTCQADGTKATCYKNSKYVTTLYPLSQGDIDYIRYQEQRNDEAWDDMVNSLNQFGDNFNNAANQINNRNKSTHTNCYKIGNQINCTSY